MYNYTVDLCILCSICIHCIVILLVCGQNSIFNGNPSGCSSWCTCRPSPHFQPKPWINDIQSFPSCFRRASENHKFMTCNPHLKSNLWPSVAKATSSSKPPIFFAAKLYILIFVSFLHTFLYYVLHESNVKIQIKIFICIFSYPVFPRPSRQVLCGHNQVHNPLSSLYRSNNKPWVSCQPGFWGSIWGSCGWISWLLTNTFHSRKRASKNPKLKNNKQFAKRSPREKKL